MRMMTHTRATHQSHAHRHSLSARGCCLPATAKEQKFWEKSKKLRTYHRVLRREGLDAGAAGGERSGPPSASASAIPTLQPEVFAVANDPLALIPQESHNKKKRVRASDAAEGGSADAAAAGAGSAAAAAAAAPGGGSSMRSSTGPLDSQMPDFKRRRLAPKELAKLKAEKAAAKAAAQAKLEADRAAQMARRREQYAMHTEKTARGQPVLAKQMQMLVEKLQKQKESAAAAKK